jgi:hypothetical protein
MAQWFGAWLIFDVGPGSIPRSAQNDAWRGWEGLFCGELHEKYGIDNERDADLDIKDVCR